MDNPLQIVHQICNIDLSDTGINYLQMLAIRASKVLGFRYVEIAIPDENAPGCVKTIVCVDDGNVIENFSYALRGTPCDNVLGGKRFCIHDKHVSADFPLDKLLTEMKVESYAGAPLLDQDGNLLGLLAFLHTEVMAGAGEIGAITEFIAARISIELRRMELDKRREQDRLHALEVEKLRIIGLLAGGIAHDFNNVLTGILGHSELIALKSADNPEVLAHAKTLISTSASAKQITRKLLDFSKPDNQEGKPSHINKVISDVIELSSHASFKKIKFVQNLNEDSDLVKISESQLQLIFLELVGNSIRSMPNGGTIRFSTRISQPGIIEIRVEDDGKGIAEEIRTKIFEPFFTTKSKEGGSGIGLATIHNIVTRYDGKIEVDSKVDKGTTFIITLPLCKVLPSQDETPSKTQNLEVQHKELRILLVEDDPSVRSFMEEILKRNEYQVNTATNAEEAVDCFKRLQGGFDLLITDLNMPGMNGIELIELIADLAPGISSILITGDSSAVERDKLQNKYNTHLLLKPFRNHELFSTIESISINTG